MKLIEYKEEVKRTIVILPTLEQNLLHMSYGVTTEVGELFDIYKKKLAYGKEIDEINYKEELGDLLWYYTNGINFGYKHLSENEFKEEINVINEEIFDTTSLVDEYKNNEFSLIGIMLDNAKEIYYNLIVKKDTEIAIQLLKTGIYIVSMMCYIKNYNFEEIMEININKLRTRFPEKFTQECATKRNLDAERKSLENKTI